VDELKVEVSFFFQPLEEGDRKHQHLELVPRLIYERHECLYFQLSHSYHHLEAHVMKIED
jgi:hypothetical protein